MAFSCGFFNSKGLDRTYTAENFTEYLSSIICNGILDTYGQNFKLTAASSGLKVILGTGKAWINGHYFVNDSRYTIDLSEYMDESLPRYVGIAIYLDTTESVRSVTLKLFPGTPAESPSLPSIPQDSDHVRLLMYAVRLNPGATELSERDWYRISGSGVSQISQPPTSIHMSMCVIRGSGTATKSTATAL